MFFVGDTGNLEGVTCPQAPPPPPSRSYAVTFVQDFALTINSDLALIPINGLFIIMHGQGMIFRSSILAQDI